MLSGNSFRFILFGRVYGFVFRIVIAAVSFHFVDESTHTPRPSLILLHIMLRVYQYFSVRVLTLFRFVYDSESFRFIFFGSHVRI